MNGITKSLLQDKRYLKLSPQSRCDFLQFIQMVSAGIWTRPFEETDLSQASLMEWMQNSLVASENNVFYIPEFYRFVNYYDKKGRETERLEKSCAQLSREAVCQIGKWLNAATRKENEPPDPDVLLFGEEFDKEIWPFYPSKHDKMAGRRKYIYWRKTGASKEELSRAVHNYSHHVSNMEEQYIMYPSTFFGPRKRWREFLKTPQKSAGKAKAGSLAEAWDLVMGEVRRVGAYDKPQFKDGHIARAVAQVGWKNICRADNFTINQLRAQFSRELKGSTMDQTAWEQPDGCMSEPEQGRKSSVEEFVGSAKRGEVRATTAGDDSAVNYESSQEDSYDDSGA